MDPKPRVRVTYGRPKAAVPEVEEREEEDALPPSSPPPRRDESSSLTLTDSSLPLDEIVTRPRFGKALLDESEEEDGDGDQDMEVGEKTGFNWDWKKKLAALDDSDDDEATPVPVPARARVAERLKPRTAPADLFSGSLPDLTSSSMPSTSPAKVAPKQGTRRVLSSPSSVVASPPRATRAATREADGSSAVSEGPSKLFESPIKAVATAAQSPDSSPEKNAPKPAYNPDLDGLFSPAASVRSRRAFSAEPIQSPGIAGKDQELEALFTAGDAEDPREGSDAEKPKKKIKKLNKKEIDQMNKETARLLAAQDASIPRFENRLSLTSLFKTIQMANGTSSQPSEGTTQLKKLPRPTNPVYIERMERMEKLAAVEDDPIIDASSPFVRNTERAVQGPVMPSSSAPSSQVPVSASPGTSAPPIQRTMSAPLPVLPTSNDPEDDLPDPAAVLAEERERRAQQLKAEEEKRRQYKLALLQRRQEQSLKTATELLKEKEAESDTDLEIEDDEPKSAKKKGPGSAKKGFMDRLVQAGHKSRRSVDVPTDSQLSRAAKPHFDMSSPPSARKNGKKDPFINRDSLNRSLLKKARRIAAEEAERKEEEWKSRGGRKRELKQEDIKAAIQQTLEKQEAAEASPTEDEDEGDSDWAPSYGGSGSENEELPDAPMLVDDAAMDEDDTPPTTNGEDAENAVRSPSYTDSNKENDNEDKENVAPSSRASRSILGEMQIDAPAANDGGDSETEEPWRPRKKRKLVNGVGLVLDDDEDAEDVEGTPIALPRKLFSDSTEQGDSLPKPIAGLGAPLDDDDADMLAPAFGSGLGGGGLSQFFEESQAQVNPLDELRHAGTQDLQQLATTNLLPAVELSTQQIQLQEEVFAEDQEARVQEALRAANEKSNPHNRPEAPRMVLAESFPMDDFTQRDGQSLTEDYLRDASVPKSVSEAANEPDSPVARPLRRLRVHVEDESEDEEMAPVVEEVRKPKSPPHPLTAFEILKLNAEREAKRARRKKIRSAFMEGEAEEEEEEGLLGFSANKDEHESDEDSENDTHLAELVDDKAMDDDTVAKEKVLEKVAEHQAEDDAALEKYHRDVIEGKKRMRRRGDDFLSDSDDEGERRRYVPGAYRRKDGAPELEKLANDPQMRAFYQAYQNTVTGNDDHEFDHLNEPAPEVVPVADDSDADSEEENDKPRRKVVSAAQLREELREAARNKATITPLMDPEDVSWVDRGDSDMEDGHRSYTSFAIGSKTRTIPRASNDEELLLANRSLKLDAKQQAKLEKFRKEDSYNASTSRGAAAVTGFVKTKPAEKQGTSNKKATGAAPRKSAVFERKFA